MRPVPSLFPGTSPIIALSASLAFAAARPASAGQTTNPHAAHGTRAGLPIAVDGSRTPERIPDDIAYHHFITLAAKPTHASPLQLARRNAWLARVGLSQSDQDQLDQALDSVSDALDGIARNRKLLSASSPAEAAALGKLKAQEKNILEGARSRLLGSLSWEGVERVNRHVQEQIKRHIVIYGDPTQ